MDKDEFNILGEKVSAITLGEIFTYLFIKINKLLQIAPLFLFYYLYNQEGNIASVIANAFIVSGGFSLFVLIFVYLTQDIIDRLTLAINLYLLVGGTAYLLQFYPLVRLIVDLQDSGVFASSVIVGFATILFSLHGFVGVRHPRRVIIYLYSFNLLSISVLALTISLHFHDSKMMGLILPFICLYICNSWLKGVLVGKY